MVTWKDVVGYEGFYQVSDAGEIKTVERVQNSYGGRSWTKPSEKRKTTLAGQYMVITLAKAGIRKRFYVHELVLKAFVGDRPPGHQACHCNGNPVDNRLENLRWGTPSENNRDKIIHKTIARGEKHGMNKYSASDVDRVRRLLADGMTAAEVEAATGVHRSTVSAIKTERQWVSQT